MAWKNDKYIRLLLDSRERWGTALVVAAVLLAGVVAPGCKKQPRSRERKYRNLLSQYEAEGSRIVAKGHLADEKVLATLSSLINVNLPPQTFTLILKGLRIDAPGTGFAIVHHPKYFKSVSVDGERVLNPGYLLLVKRGSIDKAKSPQVILKAIGVGVSDRGETVLVLQDFSPIRNMSKPNPARFGNMRGRTIAIIVAMLVD